MLTAAGLMPLSLSLRHETCVAAVIVAFVGARVHSATQIRVEVRLQFIGWLQAAQTVATRARVYTRSWKHIRIAVNVM